jgi:long-chain acyl-CoA synthetase
MNAIDFFFRNSSDLDKELLVSKQERCTYRTMAHNVSELSLWLNDHFEKGSAILLVSANNQFFITAYLSIIKFGGVCIPLNPAIEPANFEYIQEKTRAVHAFVHSTAAGRLSLDVKNTDEKAMHSIISSPKMAGYVKGPEISDLDLAQIIFTSGSTSVPKGVMITHGNLIANTQSILSYLHLSRNDTMLVVLPFFYCYGLSLLHTHLCVGGTLVLNNNFIFLGGVLRNLMDYKCTGFAGVPSHFQMLLRKSDSLKNFDFPHLRYVTQAGGKLHNSFISEFVELFPEKRFFVMYGQTEATARLSYLPPEELKNKIGSIGKGIPGVVLKVVDELGRDVKPGEIGEIVVRGDNVMKGYFEDEEASRLALQNGWLHTGDLGIVDEEGYIYLRARKKEMVKVGGKRVSPKEIEEVIFTMPGVIDCTVEGYDHPVLGEALRAIVVKNDKFNISVEDVRSTCASRLASFKIPTEVVFKDKMEVSSTGKKVKGSL